VKGRASIADLLKSDERCGIYVLHFANGEFYAGQAVDVTRRYVQHRKTHDDIDKIAFKRVPRNKLNDEERTVIWHLEQKGCSLRNVTFTSIPKGESDFDLVMSIEEQERWLNDLDYVEDSGDRLTNPDVRRKYVAHPLSSVRFHPLADGIVGMAPTPGRRAARCLLRRPQT
jgi:hypothetical protein